MVIIHLDIFAANEFQTSGICIRVQIPRLVVDEYQIKLLSSRRCFQKHFQMAKYAELLERVLNILLGNIWKHARNAKTWVIFREGHDFQRARGKKYLR